MTDSHCPGCGAIISTGPLAPGARFGCHACAGLVLEVIEGVSGRTVREVAFASCPRCEASLEVPRNALPGDRLEHCGHTLRLTLEFGAWALLNGDGG